MKHMILLCDYRKENQARYALGTFVQWGTVQYRYVEMCDDILDGGHTLKIDVMATHKDALIRRLIAARLLDLVPLARGLTNGDEHLGSYSPDEDAQFVHGLLSSPLKDLLRVFDTFAQDWLRSCSLQSPNTRGWIFEGGFNEEDYSHPDRCRPVYFGLCHWVRTLDATHGVECTIPYIFACFATRISYGDVRADYAGFWERNSTRRGQRLPGVGLRSLAERIFGDARYSRVFAEHFAPRHGPGAVAFWQGLGSNGSTASKTLLASKNRPKPTTDDRRRYSYNGKPSAFSEATCGPGPARWVHKRIPPHEKDQLVLQSAHMREWILRHGSLLPVQIVALIMSYTYSSLYRAATSPMFLTDVPKTWKTRRIIGAESCDRMWLQQGIRNGLTAVIRACPILSAHIDLGCADVNARLAQLGSENWRMPKESFGTIDLSAASDFIGLQFARAFFGRTYIGNVLMDTRPTRVMGEEGQPEMLNIFGLMGSAYTFPCQTIIFSTIVEFAARLAAKLPKYFGESSKGCNETYKVYGDDIVASIATCRAAIWLLTKYGFVVNERKTFVSGPFRESCGGEYFDGVDITPLRLPRAFLDRKRSESNAETAVVDRLKLNASKAYTAECLVGAAKLYERACDDDWRTNSPHVASVIREATLDYWGLRPLCLASEGKRCARVHLCFYDLIDDYGDPVISFGSDNVRVHKIFRYQVIEEGYYYDFPVYDDVDVHRDGPIPYEEWLSRDANDVETSASYERRPIRIEQRFLIVSYRLVEVRRLK